MKRIALFASGTGSNARKIIEYFQGDPSVEVALVVSNKASAPVLEMAASHGVPTLLIDRHSFYQTGDLAEKLQDLQIDLIVLAGFLWLVPDSLVKAFSRRIVNIHPALLPKYGGKGMYGMHVHRAVREAGETQSGITIHYVNERYDEGDILFQATCPVAPDDDAETIARRVLELEHEHYPRIVEKLLKSV
ncbi:MAG: phosphoribosylglycinamide formyltransferase [Saprospiraceae bacterium]|nr:phosphoribosylglycinamide formyltransferase [Saprospiraceae bacterium]MCB0680162.1 phosphoribosylglycinamide formyltransferase [Saprospiraceae bacterium]